MAKKCEATCVNSTRFDHPKDEHKCTLPAGHRNHLHVCYCAWTWE